MKKNMQDDMEKKIGGEPAFPLMTQQQFTWGMSKRFYAACAAMQGIMATESNHITPEAVATWAYKIADELLKQENK